MDRQANAAPIIIKRKKRAADDGGHHGGAWKVAYADFVTAMMAFFLMMWLINATTEAQRKGLADYFSPSIPVNRISGGGDGAFGGDDFFADDDIATSGAGGRIQANAHTHWIPDNSGSVQNNDGNQSQGDTSALEAMEKALQHIGGESMVADRAMRHVVTRLTDRGLIVEIFDLPDAALFEPESDTPQPVLSTLSELLAEVFALARNGISIEGHTRTFPVVLAENPVWELSAARAQRMRLLLQDAGLPEARMRRVTGHADKSPISTQIHAVRNNRLEIILLRGPD